MPTHLHDGSLWWITLALAAAAFEYLRGWRRVRQVFSNLLNARHAAAFLGGLLTVWVAVGSPLASMDHQWLTAHMAQHLLLMTVAAPLILLGAPVIAILEGLPWRFPGSRLDRLLRHPLVRKVGRMVTAPAFCWVVGTGTVVGWHVPVLFQLGMRSSVWHMAESMSFLAAGLLFWWPVVQPWPAAASWTRWGIPAYLFLATLPCDGLSAFLAFCDRVVYPQYEAAHPLSGIALADQAAAGSLMWIWVTFAYLAPAVMVTLQMLSPQRYAVRSEVV